MMMGFFKSNAFTSVFSGFVRSANLFLCNFERWRFLNSSIEWLLLLSPFKSWKASTFHFENCSIVSSVQKNIFADELISDTVLISFDLKIMKLEALRLKISLNERLT
jgi:hypothetical protein